MGSKISTVRSIRNRIVSIDLYAIRLSGCRQSPDVSGQELKEENPQHQSGTPRILFFQYTNMITLSKTAYQNFLVIVCITTLWRPIAYQIRTLQKIIAVTTKSGMRSMAATAIPTRTSPPNSGNYQRGIAVERSSSSPALRHASVNRHSIARGGPPSPRPRIYPALATSENLSCRIALKFPLQFPIR